MADDDEIARLLREIDAQSGNAPSPSAAQPTPAPRSTEVAKSTNKDVATTGGDTGAHLLMAGIAGAVAGLLAAWVFGIIPFLGNVDTLRFILAGFVGGAVGYGSGRILNRRKE